MRFFVGKRIGPVWVGVSQRVRLRAAASPALANLIVGAAIVLLVLLFATWASRP
jgi:hypothetical protein